MQRWRKVVFGCATALAFTLLVEGCSNVLVCWSDVSHLARPALAERLHTHYDAELGWTNTAGLRVEDAYGPGRTVTINAQGFRGAADTLVARPAGRTRIVCSGDSFTFGYGVADADAWPAQLGALDARLDVVNLALGGYGIDQMYLRYLRDGLPLEQDVHVVAAISDDFARMASDRFSGYGKPWLDVDGGRLVARNVPVPETGFATPWLTQNAPLFRRLGVVELARRMTGAEEPQKRREVMSLEDAANRARAALADLRARSATPLVFVYLPVLQDVLPNSTDFLREPFLEALRADGVTVIDLVPALRADPPRELDAFFLAPGVVDFPGAQGHYTPAGNRWAAEHVLAGLRGAGLAPR